MFAFIHTQIWDACTDFKVQYIQHQSSSRCWSQARRQKTQMDAKTKKIKRKGKTNLPKISVNLVIQKKKRKAGVVVFYFHSDDSTTEKK